MAEKCFCHVEINGEKIAVKDSTARAAASAAQTAANNAQTLASGISATATNALTVANEAKQIALNAGGSGEGSDSDTGTPATKKYTIKPEGNSSVLTFTMPDVNPSEIKGFTIMVKIMAIVAGNTPRICAPGFFYTGSTNDGCCSDAIFDATGNRLFYMIANTSYTGSEVKIQINAWPLVINTDGTVTASTTSLNPKIIGVEVDY